MTAIPDTAPQLKTGLRWPAVLGVLGSVLLFGGLFAWSWFTQINGAVIAQGTVEVIGKPQSVQHLDGGIVEEIRVSNGDRVEEGEVLVRLDDTVLRANLLIYKTRLSDALARQDRLVAEQQGLDAVDFAPQGTLLSGISPDLNRAGQVEIFEARRELQRGRREQLSEKIVQFGNQILGVEGLITSKEEQLDLIQSELTALETLNARGLTRASQVLGVQRDKADLLGQLAEHTSELARIQNSIRDTELEILQGERQFKEEVVTELREVTNSIQELTQQITSTRKQLERIEIRAPASGRVHEMQLFTLGGVVPPGATILQVIPRDQGLGFEMRVDPVSIDQVYPGQDARLRFTAFNQRTTPELMGQVADISPTSVVDETTGQSFYRVSMDVSEAELARLGDVELVPGMPVDAFVQTGERSVFSYLTKPLTEQFTNAFREE
ncbi:MAG: HlyD family type I secretion periplasmic adaptor subunit [Pseudomonadota bacterium]